MGANAGVILAGLFVAALGVVGLLRDNLVGPAIAWPAAPVAAFYGAVSGPRAARLGGRASLHLAAAYAAAVTISGLFATSALLGAWASSWAAFREVLFWDALFGALPIFVIALVLALIWNRLVTALLPESSRHDAPG
jgi:hypothetical protein